MTFFAQYFYFIASMILTGYALVVSSSLLNPLLAAFILALALQPLARHFERVKIPRLLSSILCMVLLLFIILSIVIFFSFQIGNMDFALDSIKITYNGVSGKMQHLITDTLNINPEEQASLLKEFYTSALKNSASFINNTLSFTTGFLSSLVLLAISLIFMLYYRRFLVSFLFKVIRPEHHSTLKRIIKKIPLVVRHYVFGLSLIILIVATLNSIGLFILGINNAVIFGVMAAILTLIPYIGILIGSLLPMIFALLTKDSLWYPVGVLAVFMLVQFLEGNFLTPNIVGRQVSINPFAAILGLILGGTLLGLTGVLFALPVLAIFKAIFDEISTLKPIGYLIGNATNTE
ncbi:AI-2E family transporter [Legionella spiritensis]|uniref:Transporter, permease n=1 Tax=Legionella spiritensis TaxID=452 RepID=A0A0W0Z598_LEGSP|nr:AI-2E family transporter [Legionella spiritensis]KTD64290.1 transporter, permease [Legionella spiritensis]SNV46871.1 transporter, permease [Legionella spiritensis]